MFDIKEENSIEVARELLPLLQPHYEEVEDKSEVIPLNVNWNLLESFFKAGIMCVITARVDNKIVGYFANILSEDFMTSTLSAREVGLYIDPEYRHTRLFLKLMSKTSDVLRNKGVVTQYITFKAGHNTDLPLRCGFTHTETTYQKILGD